jgi:hypothetical protein
MAHHIERPASRWLLVGTLVASALSGVLGYLVLGRPLRGDPHGPLTLGWFLLAAMWFWLLRGGLRARRWGLVALTALAGVACLLIFVAP